MLPDICSHAMKLFLSPSNPEKVKNLVTKMYKLTKDNFSDESLHCCCFDSPFCTVLTSASIPNFCDSHVSPFGSFSCLLNYSFEERVGAKLRWKIHSEFKKLFECEPALRTKTVIYREIEHALLDVNIVKEAKEKYKHQVPREFQVALDNMSCNVNAVIFWNSSLIDYPSPVEFACLLLGHIIGVDYFPGAIEIYEECLQNIWWPMSANGFYFTSKKPISIVPHIEFRDRWKVSWPQGSFSKEHYSPRGLKFFDIL